LQLIATQKIQPQFVHKLLVACGVSPGKIQPSVQPVIQPSSRRSLTEPLTQRECEIIELIAAGYTNQQIADRLVITLNTVKKHTTHIYGKLGVKNRTQAIIAAREFKLIP
jgi:LuxR family maltose regulon positive regulatory protein